MRNLYIFINVHSDVFPLTTPRLVVELVTAIRQPVRVKLIVIGIVIGIGFEN